MTKLLLLFLTTVFPLHSESLSDGMSIFETKRERSNTEAQQNPKIQCRVVCDKKVYKEQQISEAIEFYKKSLNYGDKKIK